MAAKKDIKNVAAKDVYTAFPSRFGSHKSMIDSTIVPKDENLVVCKDEFGHYVTEKKRLDDRCADPNRFANTKYRNRVLEETEKQ
jgi:hypothetical protein